MSYKEHKEYYPRGNIRSLTYTLNGLKHREDGPARIYYNQEGNSHFV